MPPSGRVTGAGHPAGDAPGAVQGPSFLKQLLPSGPRLELGQERHLERKGGKVALDTLTLLPRTQEPRPPAPPTTWVQGQHLCCGAGT